jgi:hypothetical protein
MESDTDRALVYRWLTLRQRELGLYTVNTQHRCWEFKQICQPFVWAPYFYGCLLCGQYHLCRLQNCPAIERDDLLTCRFSGRQQREASATGINYEDQPRAGENGSLRKSRQKYGEKPRPFSSSSAPDTRSKTEVKEQACSKNEAVEQWERDIREGNKVCDTVWETKTKPVEEEQEAAAVAVEAGYEHVVQHEDWSYWTAYYSFLGIGNVTNNFSPVKTITTRDEEEYDLVTKREVVEELTRILVGSLLKIQLEKEGKKLEPWEKNYFITRRVFALAPLLHKIIALGRCGTNTSAESLGQAALLVLLTKPFYGKDDSFSHQLPLWRGDQWLGYLAREDVIKTFVDQLAERTSQQMLSTVPVLTSILLSHNTLWLRDFLHS